MMGECGLGMDWVRIGVVSGTLLVLGVVYNAVVSWMECNGYDEGYTALLVVFGVAFTLVGIAVLCWQCALVAFWGFAASGLPMFVGSWWRHVQARRRSQDLARRGLR